MTANPYIDEGFAPITTRAGWRRLLEQPSIPIPDIPSVREFDSMSRESRERFEAERFHYVSEMPPIPELFESTLRLVRRRVAMNGHSRPIARRGVALDGKPDNGKTVTLIQAGLEHENAAREAWQSDLTPSGHKFVPTVFYSIQPNETIKQVSSNLVGFFGPVPKRADSAQLSRLLVKYAANCQTSLFLFDEIQNLQLHRKSDIEANNYLKYLANITRATFVYAGVDLEKDGFFNEGAGSENASRSQIRYRFTRCPIEPIDFASPEGRDMFVGVLKSYEDDLPLVKSEPGDIAKHSTLVWNRTRGKIGLIDTLLKDAFAIAVELGTERITKRILNDAELPEPPVED